MSSPWRLRGYVVERLLGTGGSGEVWRARVAATGEPVALKRLTQVDSRHVRRIHSEAALLSALEHPNLIRLHAVVEDGDAYVLVLDLADGGSLADLLANRACLAPGEVVTALAPVAAALAYAHGEGVVHGDVSPANVLFTAAGVPLLADLGVARLCGDDTEAESTPGYLDPAVAVGCLPGPSSDVFMLGGVALHALTGRPTWPGRSAAEFLAAARRGGLEDVAARLRDAKVPDAMAAVVSRALSSEAPGRGSAADFALDLRQSARPVAVELGARLQRRDVIARGAREAVSGGRNRTGGRHAAVVLPADRGKQSVPLPWRSLATHDGTPGKPPPTTAVRPRPRPQLPRGPRAIAVSRRLRVGAAVLVAALAIVPVALWARSRLAAGPDRHVAAVASPSLARPTGSPSHARPAQKTHAQRQVETSVRRSSPARSRHPARDRALHLPRRTGTTRWADVLATLDAIRAHAYATRDPSLLRSVYASTALRSADARTLMRLVPRGCGLAGARTSYADVRARPVATAIVVSATASLHAATLRCNGHRRGRTPAAGPVRMRIVLARSRDGPRISQEWRSA